MATEERGSLPNYKTLNLWLNNDEQLLGKVRSLKVVGSKTRAEFKLPRPAVGALVVAMPMIGGQAPPEPAGFKHELDGQALIQNVKMDVSLFRKS